MLCVQWCIKFSFASLLSHHAKLSRGLARDCLPSGNPWCLGIDSPAMFNFLNPWGMQFHFLAAQGINSRFWSCFRQEDWNQFLKRIARRSHAVTLELAILQKVYVRLRYKDWVSQAHHRLKMMNEFAWASGAWMKKSNRHFLPVCFEVGALRHLSETIRLKFTGLTWCQNSLFVFTYLAGGCLYLQASYSEPVVGSGLET